MAGVIRMLVFQKDKLAKSVERAFLTFSPKILERVHTQWKMVLHLIWAGKWTNELVDEHRGKITSDIVDVDTLHTVLNDEVSDQEDEKRM